MKYQNFIFNILFISGALASGACHAELGGTTASILVEQKQFNSQLTSTQQNGYSTYTQTLASGTTFQEYASNTGIIFAVSWSGPSLPNLQTLLGNYYGNYLSAAQQSRRSIYSSSDSLVIQSTGMMGAFQGFAFLPKQAPTNFTVNNLPQ
jgi:Protein of unknown function (DUF2844)